MPVSQAAQAAQTVQTGGFQSMDPAAQVLIAALPLVAVVLLAVLAFFSMLWDHRRDKIFLERGEKPAPRNFDDKILLLGIIALFVGVGLTAFFAAHDGLSNALLGGIIPAMTGIAVVTHYSIANRKKPR